jgi:hypothetical protein
MSSRPFARRRALTQPAADAEGDESVARADPQPPPGEATGILLPGCRSDGLPRPACQHREVPGDRRLQVAAARSRIGTAPATDPAPVYRVLDPSDAADRFGRPCSPPHRPRRCPAGGARPDLVEGIPAPAPSATDAARAPAHRGIDRPCSCRRPASDRRSRHTPRSAR